MTKEKWYRLVYDVLRPIGALLYPQKFYGLENIPEGPAILCAPHSNVADPILISFALGRKTYVHHLAKAESKTMFVFPEGTRVHGDAVVEPKSGVIHMAVRMHVPIVPVYIPRDKKIFHEVPTVIGEPYYPELGDHRDYDRLARELMERIWALKPGE